MKHLVTILLAVIFIATAFIYHFDVALLVRTFLMNNQDTVSDVTQNQQAHANQPAQRQSGQRGRPTTETFVSVAPVVYQSYTDSFTAVGTGVAQQSVSLVSEVSGQIEKVFFSGTPQVSKGDILIQLNDDNERVNVQIAAAALDKAEDTLERTLTLQARNSYVVSDMTIKEVKSNAVVAEGNLALAEIALEERSIRAPIDGKLGLNEWEVGDYLFNGAKIVEINNTAKILIEFELPERAVSILQLDKPVKATTATMQGQYFDGKIIEFDSVVDEITRTITIKAEIDNPKNELWPGMTFTVDLRETYKPFASVPAMAMVWTKAGTHIWVMNQGRVQPVPVIFHYRHNDTVWVSGALQEGARVVVDGVHKLRPGLKVSVAEVLYANSEIEDSKPVLNQKQTQPEQKRRAVSSDRKPSQ